MKDLWARWKARPAKITWLGIVFAVDDLTIKRLFKTFINTMVCLILCLIPQVVHTLGKVGYLLTLFSVIVPPSKRMGKEVESLVITLLGMGGGIGYCCLCRYICKLPLRHMNISSEKGLSGNPEYRSALGLLALCEIFMLMFHGYYRSKFPRVFAGVLTFFIVSHFGFLSDLEVSARNICINFGYPIMLACGLSLFFNFTIFPESGSTDLGKVTVNLIKELQASISLTVTYFVNSAEIMRAHIEEERAQEEALNPPDSPHSPKSMHSDTQGNTDDSHETPETYVPEVFHGDGTSPNRSAPSLKSHPELDITELGTLLKKKTVLNAKYLSCKAALTECTFEITYAHVSPTVLKPTVKLLNGICKSAGAMLDACELEFALLGKVQAAKLQKTNSSSNQEVEEQDIIKRLKPEREIVHGNKELLLAMVTKVAQPIHVLDKAMYEAFDIAVHAVCYAYSVDSDNPNIKEFPDKREEFRDAIETFDVVSRAALASLDFGTIDRDHIDDYLLPRDELFLLASFILNLKSAALSIMHLLDEAFILHSKRLERESVRTLPILGKKRIWSAVFDNWKSFSKYMNSRSDDARNDGDNIEGHDVLKFTQNLEEREAALTRQLSNTSESARPKMEVPSEPKSTKKSNIWVRMYKGWDRLETRIGTRVADFVEISPAEEKHWKFALKITIPMFLVCWPMFVPSMRLWYINMRGSWVGFVMVLVTETTLGGSVFIFVLRTVGLTIGSAWAVLAHTAGRGHMHAVMGVVMGVVFVPALWFMLGTKYFKGGMITVVSANVVLLATLYPTTPGGIVTNFAKRTLAMMIGGGTALIAQLLLFPVKAREELVVVTVQAIRECSRMERIIAYGFDDPQAAQKEFKKCAKVARGSLTAASTFREFTNKEPRLKGSFEEISKIFGEIIFVTRQIIDRLENIVFLRQQYGSVVLDEYGPEVLAYRRQTAAAITTTLRAVEAALLNKTPLPQYMPSARLAHRRFVNRVREVMISRLSQNQHRHGNVPDIGTPAVGTPRETPQDTPRGTPPIGSPLGGSSNYPLHPQYSQSDRAILPQVSAGTPRPSSEPKPETHEFEKPAKMTLQLPNSRPEPPPLIHHSSDDDSDSGSDSSSSNEFEIVPRQISHQPDFLQHRAVVLQQKFMSWSATSSAVEEVIEYVEELSDLAALLVGVNKFKYGFLSRPIYAEWAASAARAYDEVLTPHDPLKSDTDEDDRHEEPTARDDTPGVLDRDHIPRGLRKRVFSVVEHNGQMYGGGPEMHGMVPEMPPVERTSSGHSQTHVQKTNSQSSLPELTRRESIRSVVDAVNKTKEPESSFLTLRRRMGRKIGNKK